ncbi:oxidoreductase [Sphingobacterium zeae]|uniref:Scyllo-inositol 2-dehydrogenase (NADP+) n=1 Tax=Sphingobacterium zeae TaxID=1776859 RepID=A0ABU0U9P7_9SPHI|nr:oxidoreductase [Sphingobacterium zeae]MDQ1151570.1 scyllo-inositol 2-dehydrogenase (NADP+) [Sphingobacterium zeae]
MIEKIRVGLIGFGISGRVFHAPVMRSIMELDLVKVTARKADQQSLLKERYPHAEIALCADDIFNDTTIDLVVVATSNEMHYPFAKRALEAGKHVVVEKPFTNSVEQADELIALAKEKNLILAPYHNLRFNSDYRTVEKMVKSGRLGRIVNLESRFDRFRNYLRPNAWREENLPGSGIFYDLGPHLIDQALQLFGKPNGVFADLAIQRDHAQTIDNFDCLLYYDNLRVSLKGSMLAKEPTPRYRIFGMNGNFVKYGIDPQEALLRDGKFPDEDPNWGQEDPSLYGKLNIVEEGKDIEEVIPSEIGSYPDFYQNVADTILGKADLIASAEQARDVIQIIELGYRSQLERKVVSVENTLIAY